MATQKITHIEANGDQVSFKVEFENAAFRATRQENGVKVAEFPERKGINFVLEGTLDLKEIVADYARKRKIDLTTAVESAAEMRIGRKSNGWDDEEYEKAYTAAVKELAGQAVDAKTLDVTPKDLKDLLAETPLALQHLIRAAYASQGIAVARAFVAAAKKA